MSNVYITDGMRHNTNQSSPRMDQKCWLAITPAAIFIFESETNTIQSAFPLSEITLAMQEGDKLNTIFVYKHLPAVRQKTLRSLSLDENPNFRQFFESFHAASLSTQVESMCDEMNENESVILQCLVGKAKADLLMLHFKVNKSVVMKSQESDVEFVV